MYSLAACMVVGSLIGLLILQFGQLLGECFSDEEKASIKAKISRKGSVKGGKRL